MDQSVSGTMLVQSGLDNVYVKESKVCLIDGEKSELYYRGYSIETLAEFSTFEEVSFLLMYGHLPSPEELQGFKTSISEELMLSDDHIRALKLFPKNSHPVDVLRTMVSFLGATDPNPGDNTVEGTIKKAIRMLGKFPPMVAGFDRIRNGKELITPDKGANIASNFLYMLKGEKSSEYDAKIMDVALILHAEHELNASAFSSMVTISTQSDIYSAITSAIGTLKGPLHGGANVAALKTIISVGKPQDAESFVEGVLASKKKIMGFGHRVYKNFDPRYVILKKIAEEISEKRGKSNLYKTAASIENEALKRLAQLKVFPNVDFYSGIVFHLLGIPMDLFTPVFAIGRVPGWVAHTVEYMQNSRLIRPKALYTGEKDKKYIPMNER